MNTLCFNEKRDTAAIHFPLLFGMEAPRNLRNWELNLQPDGRRSTEFLGKIEEFHVLEVERSNAVHVGIHNRLHEAIVKAAPERKRICCMFQIFPNPKRLAFHMTDHPMHTAETLRIFGVRMESFVGFHGDSFVDGKLPELVIVPHGQTTTKEAIATRT